MIKSELVDKIAEENPHLLQRDVERIVGTIFEEITLTLGLTFLLIFPFIKAKFSDPSKEFSKILIL